jgi:hypothetical protein
LGDHDERVIDMARIVPAVQGLARQRVAMVGLVLGCKVCSNAGLKRQTAPLSCRIP